VETTDEVILSEADLRLMTALSEHVSIAMGRARLHAEIYESEKRFRALIENGTDLISLIGPDGTVLYASPSTRRILGYAVEEYLGRNTLELVHPDDLERLSGHLAELLQKPDDIVTTEFRLHHKDGSWRWTEGIGKNLLTEPGVRAIVVNNRDITERKQTEDELKRLKVFNESIIQSMAEGIAVEDSQGRYTFVNLAAARMLGYTPEELVGQHWTTVIPSDQWPIVRAANERRAQGEADRYELDLVRKDGFRFTVSLSGSPVFDTITGHVMGTLAVFTDITERKQVEEDLRESEAKYRTLVEQIPAVVYMDAMDETSSATFMSPQVEGMLGYSPDEWKTDPELWVKLLHPDDRPRVLVENARTNAAGEPFRMEYRLIARDGRIVWIRDEAVIMRDSAGCPRYWQGIMLDITER
jgi:PAS domain S-box-containing protein